MRQMFAAGGLLALAWWIMGAAPLTVTARPGLANSAPQFAVNRIAKGDRAVHARRSRLRDADFPSGRHWS